MQKKKEKAVSNAKEEGESGFKCKRRRRKRFQMRKKKEKASMAEVGVVVEFIARVRACAPYICARVNSICRVCDCHHDGL